MSTPILVTYATRYGSTQEVAEAVAGALCEHGLAVDLQPVGDVHTLDGYQAVVLGAPFYIGHWHKDALAFLATHHETLAERPVAVFALGPLHDDAQEFQAVRAQFDQELARFPWLTPVALALFGGTFDPAKLRFTDRLIASLPASPLHGMPAGDVRDWTAIRAWASDLAQTLRPPSAK
jgi:menaquinone-dependent protoporphyrinogen oxidase